MSDDIHDPGAFRLYYPLYVLLGPDGLLIGYDLPGTGRVLPVFTDRDLADRFVEVREVAGATVQEVALPKMLRGLLAIATEQVGVTHVGIDPSETGTRKSFVFPAAEFTERAAD